MTVEQHQRDFLKHYVRGEISDEVTVTGESETFLADRGDQTFTSNDASQSCKFFVLKSCVLPYSVMLVRRRSCTAAIDFFYCASVVSALAKIMSATAA